MMFVDGELQTTLTPGADWDFRPGYGLSGTWPRAMDKPDRQFGVYSGAVCLSCIISLSHRHWDSGGVPCLRRRWWWSVEGDV